MLKRMVEKADVLVENFRPDVKDRLGIDYETLAQDQSEAGLCQHFRLRPGRPLRDRPGFDQIAQGMGGLMSITGLPGQGPVRVGIPIADLTAGLFCALGIMVALLEREKSGEGPVGHTSLLQAQIFMLDFQAARWLMTSEVPSRPATIIRPRSRPACSRPPTAISTSPRPARRSGSRFCNAAGAKDLLEHPDYQTGADALEEPRCAQRRHRKTHREAHQRRMDRTAERSRRAVRTDLFDRPGASPIRRSSISASPRR